RMVQVSRLGGQHISERSKTVMTATHAAQLVGEYLQRLERELTDLPLDTRNEIIDEIRRHIAEESGGLSDESDAALLNLLERLGDPADIAAASEGGPTWVGVTVGAVLFTISLVALIAPVGMIVYLATRLRSL